MSRIGKAPVEVPAGVEVKIEGASILVKGPKGQISMPVRREIAVRFDKEKNVLVCERKSDQKTDRALHGLTRALIANMITGVTNQFERKLQVNGVGYSCQVVEKELSLQVGFSHPVDIPIPEDLEVVCPSNRNIVVRGVDKQKVGQFAANVRRVRPPEPYNAKGIKYEEEVVRRKAGKTFVSGGG
jgi:large subunit ribosomal protein L6